MKRYLTQLLTCLVIALSIFGHVRAQLPSGLGERLAKEAINLVGFAEMGNIGARDPECKGTAFPVTDINSLIESEIVPVMDALGRAESRLNPTERDEIIAVLRQIPNTKDNGVGVVQQLYDQKKTETRVAYGDGGVCAGLSSMVQTVIHQKRLALQESINQLGSAKPN